MSKEPDIHAYLAFGPVPELVTKVRKEAFQDAKRGKITLIHWHQKEEECNVKCQLIFPVEEGQESSI